MTAGHVEYQFQERAGLLRIWTPGFVGAAAVFMGRGRLPGIPLHGPGLLAPLLVIGAALLWLVVSRRHHWTVDGVMGMLRLEQSTWLWTVRRTVPLAGVAEVRVLEGRRVPALALSYGDGREVVLDAPGGSESGLEQFAAGLRGALDPPLAAATG